MICPKCKTEYEYKDVPFHYRRIRFLTTEFKCPFCETWLRPNKAYNNVMAAIVYLGFLGIVLAIVGSIYNDHVKWAGLSLCVSSIPIMFVSKLFLKYEVK